MGFRGGISNPSKSRLHNFTPFKHNDNTPVLFLSHSSVPHQAPPRQTRRAGGLWGVRAGRVRVGGPNGDTAEGADQDGGGRAGVPSTRSGNNNVEGVCLVVL